MSGPVVERIVRVVNRAGIHARPAAELVKLAGAFEADVRFSKEELEVNGKSIMGVLMLAAESGSTLRIVAAGPDAERAVTALGDMIADGFPELEEG